MDDILEKIYRAELKFLTPLDLDETYKTIVGEAIKLVNADYGSIVLYQDGELRRVYASDEFAYKTILHRKDGNTWRAFREKKAILAPIEEIAGAHPELKEKKIKWSLFFPLFNRGQSIGVLTVNSKREEKFTNQDLTSLRLFGSIASLAIMKAQLYSDIKKALETRDLFISMAAHELRTPLTTIHGYSQLLMTRASKLDPTERKWIEELMWETNRLRYLVNELLEINKIKAGQVSYNFKVCDIREVVEHALASFNVTSPKREIVYKDGVDRPCLVIGDFDKLLQVITNLLDNAIKYSGAKTPILINVKPSSKQLVVQVVDYGRGIDRKDISKVFENYYRGSDPQAEGLGLGLFLVKEIIEKHRGDIRLKSKKNKGTKVEVVLPLAKL